MHLFTVSMGDMLMEVAQLRFALSSASVFCRSDTLTDSERFYESVLEFLDDPEEESEVSELLNWWNWYGNSSYITLVN